MLLAALLSGCDESAESAVDDGAVDSGEPDADADADIDTATDIGDLDRDTAQEAAEEAAYAAFYDVRVVQQVVLALTSADADAMDEEALREYTIHPSNPVLTYFPASITINGETIADVGVRLKGSSTFQFWEQKPSLKVKFSENDPDQRFAGLKRATFNNMTGDPAMSREVVGYHFWQEAGMAVPAANFAQVWVSFDGADPLYYGLYTNLEAMDSEWVERNFDGDGGDLWEGNDSADFSRSGIDHFALVTGLGDKDLLDIARDQVQNHGDDFYAEVNDVLDMDNFLDFWTLSLAIGNRDGYPFHLNDYFVYLDPGDARFDFIPWGMDESFDTATPTYANYVTGAVAANCLYYDATCPKRYLDAMEQNLDLYEASDIATFAGAMQDLTVDAMTDDTRKNWAGYALTAAQVETYRTTLNYRIEMYPGWLRVAMGL